MLISTMPGVYRDTKRSMVNFVGGRKAKMAYRRGDPWAEFWRIKRNWLRTHGAHPGRPSVWIWKSGVIVPYYWNKMEWG